MKRADIQGLRTVAILGVVLYHIWPAHFPSGFLGVDVFFVISGHLMAGCLANFVGITTKMDKVWNKLLQFYGRRIKRIVPMYLAMICGTFSISRTIMLDSDFQKARVDMYWALAFVSNIQPLFDNHDYFAEVFAYRPLLHCWSLGVEMQFYLFVPLAMFALLSLRGKRRRFLRFACCATVLLLSVTVQQLFSATGASPAASFGLVFSRLWQFFAGILVHFLNADDDDDDQRQRRRHEDTGMEGGGGVQKVCCGQIGWPYVLGGQSDINKESKMCGAGNALAAPLSTISQQIQATKMPSSASPPPVPTSTTASLIITSCSTTSSAAGQHEVEEAKNNLSTFLWHCATVHALLLLLLGVLFSPFGVPASVMPLQSTFVVLLAAAQLHVHYQPPGLAWPPSPLLTNFFAVQLGDLSYIWYLVHWPTIVFIKYFFTVDQFSTKSLWWHITPNIFFCTKFKSFFDGLFTLLLTLMLALLLDRILDAHIRALPTFCSVFLLIGLIYTFCFFLVLPTYYSGQIERIATEKDNDASLGQRSVTLDTNFTKMIIDELQTESRKRLISTLSLYEKIKMNELLQSATFDDRYKLLVGEELNDRWTQQLKAMLLEERNSVPQKLLKYVIERQITGTGNGTVLLLGNSHADVVARELSEEMRAHYHKFAMFTMPGCMPIGVPEHYIPFDPGHIIPCPFYTRTVAKIVEETRPDTLFLVFRWYNELHPVPFNENGTTNDEILTALRHELRHFQKFTNQIFISAPTLQFKHEVAKELAKRLWQHAALGDLHLSRKEHYSVNRFSYARLRHLDCPKCVLFDMADHFCDERLDKCAAFDDQTQLAYFFDNNHLSYVGRQAIRPFLRSMVNKTVEAAAAARNGRER